MVLSLTVKNFVTVKIVRVCCGSVSAKAKKRNRYARVALFAAICGKGRKKKRKKRRPNHH